MKEKAVSEIVGAAIALSIIVATMVPLAILIMDSQRTVARALEEKAHVLEERLSESLELRAWRNSTTGTLWILVSNRGGEEAGIAHVIAIPAARPENLSIRSFAPGEVVVKPRESLSMDTGIRAPGDVLVKLITSRVRIYTTWAGSPPGEASLTIALKSPVAGAVYNVAVEGPGGFYKSIIISPGVSESSAEVSVSVPAGKIYVRVYTLSSRGWDLIYEVQAEVPGIEKIFVSLSKSPAP